MTNQPAASTYEEERAARERIANTHGGYYIPDLQANPQKIIELIQRLGTLQDSIEPRELQRERDERTIAELRGTVTELVTVLDKIADPSAPWVDAYGIRLIARAAVAKARPS